MRGKTNDKTVNAVRDTDLVTHAVTILSPPFFVMKVLLRLSPKNVFCKRVCIVKVVPVIEVAMEVADALM